MRFFRRESTLETLQRQLAAIDKQIQELKDDLQALKGNEPIDPVLKLWLQTRYGFDYNEQKTLYTKLLNEKKARLNDLTKEKAKVEAQLQKLLEKERIRAMQIRFEGLGILSSEGSIAKIKCQNCSNVFEHDFQTYGGFINLLQCANQAELNFCYSRGVNIFEIRCPKCGNSMIIKAFRGKI
jgi:predicted RNase H-like nuclease (RuvC/YqgF family)